jgi:predicted RNase H-like nuclease
VVVFDGMFVSLIASSTHGERLSRSHLRHDVGNGAASRYPAEALNGTPPHVPRFIRLARERTCGADPHFETHGTAPNAEVRG